MNHYISKFGSITNDSLTLFKLENITVPLENIAMIKIAENKLNKCFWFINFTQKQYRFTIYLENGKQVEFPFKKDHLSNAIEFNKNILLVKNNF